ncbi:hypothetical protein [Sulfitobacter aestuariivivens]|uniref:Uncharacterized protein n=1 Tax=Sulfitobacter aestuariivivens TaxID=2766981 RepID=A0A927HDR8_9RHOB|nr:hypothetical protein [Sulfitobacter aestuariivivens]MBD3662618.1 hypothetical protein [Sulfitobacter aestuariivivens]
MHTSRKTAFTAIGGLTHRGKTVLARGASKCRDLVRLSFQQEADLDRLSERLQRDAGLDAQNLEMSRISRAPLIR